VLYRIVKLHILPAISLFASRTVVQLNLQEVLCLYQHTFFQKNSINSIIYANFLQIKNEFFLDYLK